MGLHQDEAYSAYNAWAVMHYGVDSYGYTRPVYYTAWGSGMSVLYSYLTMPFLAVFGIRTWVIRLPQAILGCLSILAVYGLGKEARGKWTGLAFAALLAINPWHVMASRFGLDANLAIPMLLFGMYFLFRYLKGKRNSIWGAAIFLGLTLYSYALTWILVPGILVFTALLFRKRISWDRQLLGAVFVLFVMALPLILFLGVNFDFVPEIRTKWFSIPKLPAIRTGELEFSLRSVKKRLLWLVSMLWVQHDDLWWVSDRVVGSYYYVSTPFIILGMLYHAKVFAEWVLRRKKELPIHFLLAVWFGVAFLVGCSIDRVKFYKVNFIHIPVILYGAVGVICLYKMLRKMKPVPVGIAVLYLFSFGYFIYSHVSFEIDYNNYGNPMLSHMHWYQYEEALDRAKELTEGTIACVGLNYANVMLYEQISPWDYMEQVVYSGDKMDFREVDSIGRYCFNMYPGPEEPKGTVFVYYNGMEESFRELGYEIERVTDCYGVAYLKEERDSIPSEAL